MEKGIIEECKSDNCSNENDNRKKTNEKKNNNKNKPNEEIKDDSQTDERKKGKEKVQTKNDEQNENFRKVKLPEINEKNKVSVNNSLNIDNSSLNVGLSVIIPNCTPDLSNLFISDIKNIILKNLLIQDSENISPIYSDNQELEKSIEDIIKQFQNDIKKDYETFIQDQTKAFIVELSKSSVIETLKLNFNKIDSNDLIPDFKNYLTKDFLLENNTTSFFAINNTFSTSKIKRNQFDRSYLCKNIIFLIYIYLNL